MRPGTEACALRKRLDCFASFEDLPSLRVARCEQCGGVEGGRGEDVRRPLEGSIDFQG